MFLLGIVWVLPAAAQASESKTVPAGLGAHLNSKLLEPFGLYTVDFSNKKNRS
jgi:hypothetical protein